MTKTFSEELQELEVLNDPFKFIKNFRSRQ